MGETPQAWAGPLQPGAGRRALARGQDQGHEEEGEGEKEEEEE